jgi:hypothetical protein
MLRPLAFLSLVAVLTAYAFDPNLLTPASLLVAIDNAGPPPGPYCSSPSCTQNNGTCCTLDSGKPGCCKNFGPNATCCGVGDLCCPSNTDCDPIYRTCVQRNQNDTTCDVCQYVVNALEKKGCGLACSILPPPANLICGLVMNLGLCDEILDWIQNGGSPRAACTVTTFYHYL